MMTSFFSSTGVIWWWRVSFWVISWSHRLMNAWWRQLYCTFFLFLFSSSFFSFLPTLLCTICYLLYRKLRHAANNSFWQCRLIMTILYICKLLHDNTRLDNPFTGMESKIKLTKFIEISDLVWRYVLWCDVVCILFFYVFAIGGVNPNLQ